MTRKTLPLLPLLPLLLLVSVAPVLAAQETPGEKAPAGPPHTYSNRYEIRFLDLHSAEQLAWGLCSPRDSCRVTAQSTDGKDGGILGVEADAATHQKVVSELARLDVAPKTQRFQLILLSGSAKAGSSPKDLSPGAQKALNDLKGFLPYKSYELLDSSFLPATRESTASARLVGLAGAAYNLKMAFQSGGSGADAQLFVSRFQLREDPSTTPLVPIHQDGSSPVQHRSPRDLVDTTFSLKPGETIVVGTSRLDGSEDALVILLTALG